MVPICRGMEPGVLEFVAFLLTYLGCTKALLPYPRLWVFFLIITTLAQVRPSCVGQGRAGSAPPRKDANCFHLLGHLGLVACCFLAHFSALKIFFGIYDDM